MAGMKGPGAARKAMRELAPLMTDAEQALLRQLLQEARIGLEFGLGGSTALAAQLDVPRYFAIDSDRKWVRRCRGYAAIAPLVDAGRFVLHHVDIGPTKLWGYPEGKEHRADWPRYHGDIWQMMDAPPDLVLVDGRFRVACALQAALHCEPGAIVAVHDFTRRSRRYGPIASALRTGERVDSLQLFHLDRRPDAATVGALLAASAYDPR